MKLCGSIVSFPDGKSLSIIVIVNLDIVFLVRNGQNAWKCFYSLRNLLVSKVLNRPCKILLNKTIIRPVAMNGWSLDHRRPSSGYTIGEEAQRRQSSCLGGSDGGGARRIEGGFRG